MTHGRHPVGASGRPNPVGRGERNRRYQNEENELAHYSLCPYPAESMLSRFIPTANNIRLAARRPAASSSLIFKQEVREDLSELPIPSAARANIRLPAHPPRRSNAVALRRNSWLRRLVTTCCSRK
jgi:hypothetical protein